MNSKVTGQQRPGKGKKYLRPSYIIMIASIVLYLGASAWVLQSEAKAYEASLPQPWLNTWLTDLRSFYMKARPARFPRDIAELDAAVWTRAAGQPARRFGDNNHSFVFENYKYIYFPAPGRPDVCTVLAYPLGPRRYEPGVKSFFLIITPNALSRWEGRAIADEDIVKMPMDIPSLQNLQVWGLVNVDPKPAANPTPGKTSR